jgi:DNA-binding HxlR family transcriptional regulator
LETQRQVGFRCGRQQLRVFRLVGKRWTLPILAALMHGPARFSEVGRSVPGLSERVLSERLQELGEAGLVERQVGAGAAAGTWYRLTAAGEHLRPAVESLLQAAAALPE